MPKSSCLSEFSFRVDFSITKIELKIPETLVIVEFGFGVAVWKEDFGSGLKPVPHICLRNGANQAPDSPQSEQEEEGSSSLYQDIRLRLQCFHRVPSPGFRRSSQAQG